MFQDGNQMANATVPVRFYQPTAAYPPNLKIGIKVWGTPKDYRKNACTSMVPQPPWSRHIPSRLPKLCTRRRQSRDGPSQEAHFLEASLQPEVDWQMGFTWLYHSLLVHPHQNRLIRKCHFLVNPLSSF